MSESKKTLRTNINTRPVVDKETAALIESFRKNYEMKITTTQAIELLVKRGIETSQTQVQDKPETGNN